MILLLNAPVMPSEGVYTLRVIEKKTFTQILKKAIEAKNFKSYIACEDTARLIEDIIGVKIPTNRKAPIVLPSDTQMTIHAKMIVPHANPQDKASFQPAVEGFEFFQCTWTPYT